MKPFLPALYGAMLFCSVNFIAVVTGETPSAQFKSLVYSKIMPARSEELFEATLELWGVFDLLKAIHLTERDCVVVVRELLPSLAGLAALTEVAVETIPVDMKDLIRRLMGEVIDAFEMAFERVATKDVFLLEGILRHIEFSLDSESPAIFNNA